MALGADAFGLKVTFLQDPAFDPPPTVMGVPVEYWVGERPRLMGRQIANWRRKALAGR